MYSISNRDCSGSDGDAYDNMQDIATVVAPGDNILFREGTYRQELEWPRQSGTPGNWITYKPYNDEKVILTGLAKVNGFTKCTSDCNNTAWNNIYYFDIPASWSLQEDPRYFEQNILIMDDEKLMFSRWPNQDLIYWPWDTSKMYNPTEAGDQSSLVDTIHLTQANGFWNNGFIQVKDSGKSEGHIKKILDFTNSKITWEGTISTAIETADTYAIFNNLYGLDKEGEFVIDFDTRRLYIYFNDDPSNHNIGLSTLTIAFSFDSSVASKTPLDYTIIEGFEIYGYRAGAIGARYEDHNDFIIRNNKIHRNGATAILISNQASSRNALTRLMSKASMTATTTRRAGISKRAAWDTSA